MIFKKNRKSSDVLGLFLQPFTFLHEALVLQWLISDSCQTMSAAQDYDRTRGTSCRQGTALPYSPLFWPTMQPMPASRTTVPTGAKAHISQIFKSDSCQNAIGRDVLLRYKMRKTKAQKRLNYLIINNIILKK